MVYISDVERCIDKCMRAGGLDKQCFIECFTNDVQHADAIKIDEANYIIISDRLYSRSKTISVKLPEYFVNDLDRLATRLGVSRSELIRRAVYELFKKEGIIRD